jgi:hypothetical protein
MKSTLKIIVLSLLFSSSCLAADFTAINQKLNEISQETPQPNERQPAGSTTTCNWTNNGDLYVFQYHNATSGSNWVVNAYLHDFPPLVCEDSGSGIIYYVESDRRHVAAIKPDGTILWYRDPFADAHMEYYRTDDPRIVNIAVVKRKSSEDWKYEESVLRKKGVSTIITIGFNSSQFGMMDITTGDFHMTGQL